MSYPNATPNAVISDPRVRKLAGIVLGVALLVLPVAQIIETETALDFGSWLPAAVSVTAFLGGVFGLTVTTPNVPTVNAEPPTAADTPYGVQNTEEPLVLPDSVLDLHDDGTTDPNVIEE